MSEFQKNDVVVEIFDMECKQYAISDVYPILGGYWLDRIVDGIRYDTCEWKTFEKAHTDFVKIGTWDGMCHRIEDGEEVR